MPTTAIPTYQITRDSRGLGGLLERLKALLSIDFPDHDARLLGHLAAAKGLIETYTGQLLSPSTVAVEWGELYDFEDLPYGPVRGPVSVTDGRDTPLSDVTLTGLFPRLTGSFATGVKLTYAAGYDELSQTEGPLSLPEELQEAVCQLAANLFDGGNRNWRQWASAYRRGGWAQ